MTDEAKKIKEKLDMIHVNRDLYNMIIKDRIDFGFDSIYFRYASVRDELMMYKVIYDKGNLQSEKQRASHDKMRFWKALEQYVHAHEEEEENAN